MFICSVFPVTQNVLECRKSTAKMFQAWFMFICEAVESQNHIGTTRLRCYESTGVNVEEVRI